MKSRYDVVIIGGGHNGLTAAAYLSGAGLSVLVLEKNKRLGGAAVSREIFSGFDARISEYAYLVNMFPDQIKKDLELRFRTKQRKFASFSPVNRGKEPSGLLVSNQSPKITQDSFRQLTGGNAEYRGYQKFLELTSAFATRVWPTLLEPMPKRRDLMQRFMDDDITRDAWLSFIEDPLGERIEQLLHDDLIRGLIFTDAKIGILTHPHDPTLIQNKTFLYHIMGNGTGEWQIPVGGMGRITSELERVARKNGAEFKTEADVQTICQDNSLWNVRFFHKPTNKDYTVNARFVLANVAPQILNRMLDEREETMIPEGSFFKINMLLKRLPLLKAPFAPRDAFIGTMHINEGYKNMQLSFQSASKVSLPENPPGEIYCHTLTDHSIFSPKLAKAGFHTLTLFGLDMPYSLFNGQNEQMSEIVKLRYLETINQHLREPIESCLARDCDRKPCIEIKSPVDIERELGMPKGNIFHQELSWPFAEDYEEPGLWGVETKWPNIFICGAGARRGGCVSGIPGHNAAMKVLEKIKQS